MSPALAGRFLTTAPPGKSPAGRFLTTVPPGKPSSIFYRYNDSTKDGKQDHIVIRFLQYTRSDTLFEIKLGLIIYIFFKPESTTYKFEKKYN